jgi:hypothetical protein
MKRLYVVLSLIAMLAALALPAIARADDGANDSPPAVDGWTWDESNATVMVDGWTWDES